MSSLGSGYQFVQHEREELHKKAEGQLRALLDRLGVAGNPVVTEGEPAAELVHLAGEVDAELAVLGATGRSALRQIVLGRAAERVVRHAPCSVLVVRAASGEARGG